MMFLERINNSLVEFGKLAGWESVYIGRALLNEDAAIDHNAVSGDVGSI